MAYANFYDAAASQIAFATALGHNKVWSKGAVLKTIKSITC
jgi:hypothetical protein